MQNKPKYNFFKNTKYAINGIKDLVKTETSFKIELVIIFLLTIIILFIDTTLVNQILLFSSLIGILISEATNSAIERVVDLVILEHNEMAGRAKDVGSAIVFLSIFLALVVWSTILLNVILG